MRFLAPTDRVLVRMPNWVGDFVAAEPLVRTIYERAAAVGASERMTLAAPAPLLPLFEERFPRLHRLPLTRHSEGEGWRGHDWALFLNGSLRSVIAAWRAGIPARVGPTSGGRSWFLTHPVRPALERGGRPLGIGRVGTAPRYLPRPFDGVVDELGAAVGVHVSRRHPLLVPTDDARWRVKRRLRVAGLEAEQPFLVVNVGARPGSSKALPTSSWVQLIEGVRGESDLPLFLVGGPGEEGVVLSVRESLGGGAPVHALTEPAPALPELIALCAAADAVLCTDGGVRHVARAVHAPCLVLFGPTDRRHTADHGDRERHVAVQVDCGPCHLEVCPVEGEEHHACMARLPVEEALEAALERVEEGGRIRALRT